MTKTTSITILALWCGVAAADEPAPPKLAPAVRALVVHVPPTSVSIGDPVELEAMIDAPFSEALSVRWRAIGEARWHDAGFERSSAGGWFASLAPAASPGLEYWIRGQDSNGQEVAHFASEQAPHVVRVDPSLADRLEVLDLDRLAGHVDEIAVDVMGHNFGNRYDLKDEFIRGELVYTHRFLRLLHHVSFGFGTIGGKTPLESNVDVHDKAIAKGERYGFGEVRLRADRSVFVDLRVALGVSHVGFDQGVRGQVTFGKPWRSSVSLGGEYIGDLGPSAWVRLQWDTAPPVLMGASIVRTDLPGAVIRSAGLYIAYDIAYQIAQRLTVRAQMSYGSRDGSAHLGAGLGTAIAF